MSVVISDPITTRTTVFTCDRCGLEHVVEQSISDSDDVLPMPALPDGWKSISFTSEVLAVTVQFDKRGCMSTWLGNQVRTLYGEDAIEVPKLRRGREAPDAELIHVPEGPDGVLDGRHRDRTRRAMAEPAETASDDVLPE